MPNNNYIIIIKIDNRLQEIRTVRAKENRAQL